MLFHTYVVIDLAATLQLHSTPPVSKKTSWFDNLEWQLQITSVKILVYEQ